MAISLAPRQTVTLKMLGGNELQDQGRVIRFEECSMEVETDLELPLDAPVEITWSGYVLLGEVVGIRRHPSLLLLNIRHGVILTPASAAATT